MYQLIAVAIVDRVLSQRPRLKYVIANIAKIEPVNRLVDKAGFASPLIVGTKAITKTQLPIENTQSCQGIVSIINQDCHY